MIFFRILFLLKVVFLLCAFAQDGVPPPDPVFEENKNFIELYDKEDQIQQVEGMQLDVNKNLSLLKNMQLALKPKTISIVNTTIIKLELHPIYFTKIFLPQGANIVNFEPSIPMRHLDFKWNRAKIRPNPDFVACNIDLTFEYEGRFYDVSIFVEKYDVSRHNSEDNLFYPKILLTLNKPLSPIEVISLYRESYNELPKDELTYFQNKDLVYKIETGTLDDRNPLNTSNVEVLYSDKVFKYKVTNGTKNN
jgi:hypothetical protein